LFPVSSSNAICLLECAPRAAPLTGKRPRLPHYDGTSARTTTVGVLVRVKRKRVYYTEKQTFSKAGDWISHNQFRVARNGNKGVLQIKIAYQSGARASVQQTHSSPASQKNYNEYHKKL
jgi:hypothetical protein